MPPKSLKAIATNFSGGFIDAMGLSYLLCLKESVQRESLPAGGADGLGVQGIRTPGARLQGRGPHTGGRNDRLAGWRVW
jgi:hypothetical protein